MSEYDDTNEDSEDPGDGFRALDLSHRDDMSDEMLEFIAEAFPGKTPVFVGDAPIDKMPPELLESLRLLDERMVLSHSTGMCIGCDAEIADYRPSDPDWEPPEDWEMGTTKKGINHWVCPACQSGHQIGSLKTMRLHVREPEHRAWLDLEIGSPPTVPGWMFVRVKRLTVHMLLRKDAAFWGCKAIADGWVRGFGRLFAVVWDSAP